MSEHEHEQEQEPATVEVPDADPATPQAPTRRAARRWIAVLGTVFATAMITVVLAATVVWLGRDGWVANLYGQSDDDEAAADEPDPHAGHDHAAMAGGDAMASDQPTGPVQVMVTDAQRLLANVGTEPVRARQTRGMLRTVGRVVLDETRMATQTAWVDGRIEQLDVRETGQRVEQGQRIASVYSAELLEAQEVYLTARAHDSRATNPLVEQARNRLELLGMSRSAIRRLERTGKADPVVSIHATSTGTFTRRRVEQGQYVKKGEVLLEIADLSKVWVEAEVYERDMHLVEVGTTATIQHQGTTVAEAVGPAEAVGSTRGEVAFVYPYLDDKRHIGRVRLEVANPDQSLRPNQYVDVVLEVARGQSRRVVPPSAIVRTGGLPRAWVEVQPGVFEARLVALGGRSGNDLVVSEGLREGDPVVVTGTFLVDSQGTLEQPAAMRLLGLGKHPFHRPGGLVPQPGAMVGDRTVCPVMENEFTVTATSPSVEHDGNKVFFCCAGCDSQFADDPDGFLERTRHLGGAHE